VFFGNRYKKLYEATQALRQKRHTSQQKTEYYRIMEEILVRKIKD